MKEYEMQILIKELQKLIASKQTTIEWQKVQIDDLKAEIERLEELEKQITKRVCDKIRESILNLKDIKDIMTVILPNNYERVYVRQPKVIEILDQIEKE